MLVTKSVAQLRLELRDLHYQADALPSRQSIKHSYMCIET